MKLIEIQELADQLDHTVDYGSDLPKFITRQCESAAEQLREFIRFRKHTATYVRKQKAKA